MPDKPKCDARIEYLDGRKPHDCGEPAKYSIATRMPPYMRVDVCQGCLGVIIDGLLKETEDVPVLVSRARDQDPNDFTWS